MKRIILSIVLLLVMVLAVACDSDTSTSTYTTTTAPTLDDIQTEDINFENGYYENYDDEEYIILDGNSESYDITEEGTYVLTGTISETIFVELDENDDARLILDNVTIITDSNPAILIVSGDDIVISLPESTENYVSDSSNYDSEYSEYNSTIYSDCDLVINGSGSLEIDANYNNALMTKDDLMIVDATLTITSVDDGIIGRDSLSIRNALISIICNGDAIKTTNEENEEDGFLYIDSGTFSLISGSDGLDAVNYIIIVGGTFDIEADSQGIRSDAEIYIAGGSIVIDSTDDCINSNTYIEISGGDIILDTDDDAIKAESAILVNGGTITINSCYEGLESASIVINGGTIDITSSDDGMNATSGSSSSFNPMAVNYDCSLTINDGEVTIVSNGDSIDSNGTLTINGGTVYAYGPMNDNSPYDSNGTFTITGGVVFGSGSSQMPEAPSTSSTQPTIYLTSSYTIGAGYTITLTDEDDMIVFETETTRNANIILISLSSLNIGDTYTLSIEGLGEYSVTLTSSVTYIGSTTQNPTNPGIRPGK